MFLFFSFCIFASFNWIEGEWEWWSSARLNARGRRRWTMRCESNRKNDGFLVGRRWEIWVWKHRFVKNASKYM
ncbi:hypothetical protein BKA64DRAFT_684393 [Cadophora sp. MPI-SDFR-AT-0126]|nr:hypothetical protein BKA64DRAFT_684393 [Leotiomycetes sp. MPI-SDFR-AT-0126]